MIDEPSTDVGSDPVVERLARLELTLLEIVTTLGVLVREVADRMDVELERPELVDGALERAWLTLFDPERPQPGSRPARDVVADWASLARLEDAAPAALLEAMDATAAAVGAIYAVADGFAQLVAFDGYPSEVMHDFQTVSLDADLPVAEAARSRRPLWFAARTQIVDSYPHLKDAHELTEQTLGLVDVQGAVVPLLAGDRVGAVVILGFAASGQRNLDDVRTHVVRAITTANPPA